MHGKLEERLGDKLSQRLGWQPRCKPTILSSGRILLPLYSDTYSFSLMAVSDDDGDNLVRQQPLIGFGNIQPAVLERKDGTLVAYMRENGITDKIRVCRVERQRLDLGTGRRARHAQSRLRAWTPCGWPTATGC